MVILSLDDRSTRSYHFYPKTEDVDRISTAHVRGRADLSRGHTNPDPAPWGLGESAIQDGDIRDGGGVRGYSMMILLQELMHRTFVEIHGHAPKRHEIPKPCDHFDLIAGTGTGGLIAIMLGRLRLDLETCKDVYVRMTRRVFETDKTIAGIPYRSTLFKASKLEEAIRECVREHTVFDDEGNDSLAIAQDLTSPMTPTTPQSAWSGPQRSPSVISRASYMGPTNPRASMAAGRFGNPDALLYDVREQRTKTAITAVYKGSKAGAPAALLRSYDSRKEPAPEFECRIWQAGRATSATGLAFKPIQIGQSIFIDEGNGKFNPSPQILDEAAINEYPGRDVGVFVSIGTGKRPTGSDAQKQEWWESFAGGSLGNFADAKRRLFAKIEGCEDTHQYMMREHLAKRNVNASNYYRLNVEVGVGEFGMNEWSRLTDISTNTRIYLSRQDVQNINQSASAKLANIHKTKLRFERAGSKHFDSSDQNSIQESLYTSEPASVPYPLAVELPADEGYSGSQRSSQQASPPHHYQQLATPEDKFAVLPGDEPRVSSDEYPQPVEYPTHQQSTHQQSTHQQSTHQQSTHQHSTHQHSTHQQYKPLPSRPSHDQYRYSQSQSSELVSPPTATSTGPPPLPPKTPVNGHGDGRQSFGSPRPPAPLPYPDTDGPPPPVNMARKPEFGVR
ncbi:MAG: hypothetical protein M1828_003259 [Chrysothrix sp. TS-e1954]|nr:MAG: hypothetical protein M1828_003259 [Chrysothrix sp. TS-e1954]